MKSCRIILMAVLLSLLVALCACGGGNTEATTTGTGSGATTTDAASESQTQKAEPENKTLNLFNYGDYIAPGLIEAFEKETGIKVRQDTFDTNEDMYEKVAGGAVYDLIVAGDYTVEKMIKNDLLQPVNQANLSNAKDLDPEYMVKLAVSDPGNQYAIPYTWGTLGIMYNTSMIEEGSITSWRDLWNADYEKDGIIMMNSVRDTFMVAEKILGIDMNTTSEDDLKKVVDLLMEQKPLVQAWKTDEARDDMVEGSAAISMIYSGEYLYCTAENEDIAFCIPEEGTNVWFDCFVIPKNSKNISAAELFIDFMLRPENGVATFEEYGYPIPSTAARALLKKEYLEDENIFPPQEVLDKCDVFHYLGPEVDEMLNSYWKQYKGN